MSGNNSLHNIEPCIESALVSCDWLAQNLFRSYQVILDATFFLARQQRNALAEFYVEHIPGSQFFDIDLIADRDNPLPHTLPTTDQFARQIGQFGIDNHTCVIIYDRNRFFASARAWWMFRVFGHDNVKVLDGGLTLWKKRGFPITSARINPKAMTFNAIFRPELFVSLDQMKLIQQHASRQILDARSEDGFKGQRPLREPGLQPGHIPDSINLPYRHLYTDENQTLVSQEQLRRMFLNAGVELDKPIAASCGSGVSAALLLLALFQLGLHDEPLYDGSWAEWGRQADLPKRVDP
ncbi:MAG: 3-mercaptopyruvate sulfurtransferase [Gammaproteobacteria bacterium]